MEPVRAIDVLGDYADRANRLMEQLMEMEFRPDQAKPLRLWRMAEVAEIFEVTESYLRKLLKKGDIPEGQLAKNNRRLFSLSEIHDIRRRLAQSNPAKYDPQAAYRNKSITKVIGCPNFKGGVGKTTTAVPLAQQLCLEGFRVLFVDLDPQASATCLFGLLPNINIDAETTLEPWFERNHPNYRFDNPPPTDIAYSVHETNWDGLDLIPSNLALGHADIALSTTHNDNFQFWKQLTIGLDTIKHNYDVVVIDFPPSLGYLSINAIYASTGLIIPIPPGMLDFASASSFFEMLYDVAELVEAQEEREFFFDFVKVLMTKVESGASGDKEPPSDQLEYLLSDNKAREQKRLKAYLLSTFGDAVLHSEILNSEAIREATRKFQTVLELDQNHECSRATFKRCKESLRAVHREIIDLLHQAFQHSVEQAQ